MRHVNGQHLDHLAFIFYLMSLNHPMNLLLDDQKLKWMIQKR